MGHSLALCPLEEQTLWPYGSVEKLGGRVASGQALQQPAQASSEEGPSPGSVGSSPGLGIDVWPMLLWEDKQRGEARVLGCVVQHIT